MVDEIYIRNKQRARSILNNRIRSSQKYTPEYVRQDVEPQPRSTVSHSDNMYSQQKQEQAVRPPLVKRDPPAPPKVPLQSSVTVGHDDAWFNNDPNTPIAYDQVSLPDNLQNKQSIQNPIQKSAGPTSVVEVGEYCIVVNDSIVFSSHSIEDIEDAIQILVYEKQEVQSHEISVFKKLGIKLGVSVR